MRLFIRFLFLSFWIVELTSCTIGNGTICGPQTPKFYCDKDAYEKLMHTKSYGEDWTKPNMTKESWRQDWVECGGMSDGSWANDAPEGATSAMIRAASDRVSEKIDQCMRTKDYEYRYTGPFVSPKNYAN